MKIRLAAQYREPGSKARGKVILIFSFSSSGSIDRGPSLRPAPVIGGAWERLSSLEGAYVCVSLSFVKKETGGEALDRRTGSVSHHPIVSEVEIMTGAIHVWDGICGPTGKIHFP